MPLFTCPLKITLVLLGFSLSFPHSNISYCYVRKKSAGTHEYVGDLIYINPPIKLLTRESYIVLFY